MSVRDDIGPLPFFDFPKWLILASDHEMLIWRDTSIEPVRVPVPRDTTMGGVFASLDRSHLVGYIGTEAELAGFRLPADGSLPFIPERTEVDLDEILQRRLKPIFNGNSHITEDVCITLPTQKGLTRSMFVPGMIDSIRVGTGLSLSAIVHVLQTHAQSHTLLYQFVYSLIHREQAAWLIMMELCERFNLKSRTELVKFIVNTVSTYRPALRSNH